MLLLLLEIRNISRCIRALAPESLQMHAANMSRLLQPYIPILKKIVHVSEAR